MRGRGFNLVGLCFAIATVVAATAGSSAGTPRSTRVPPLPVLQLPHNLYPPVIGGSLVPGGTLFAHPGTWGGDGPKAFAYKWLTCANTLVTSCSDSAAGPVFVAHQVGDYFRLRVLASNAAGGVESLSEAIGPVESNSLGAPGRNIAPPQIMGLLRVGNVLETSEGLWVPEPGATTYGVQWARCVPAGGCSDVRGAVSTHYVVTDDDLGYELQARVWTTKTLTATSSRAGPVSGAATLPDFELLLPPPITADPWQVPGTEPQLPPATIEPLTFHPLLSLTDYDAATVNLARAAVDGPSSAPSSSGTAPRIVRARRDRNNPNSLAPINFGGTDQRRQGAGIVPDTHGGVGTEYFLEMTNHRVDIYDKFAFDQAADPYAPPEPLKAATQDYFFVDPSTRLSIPYDQFTDPRAVKDPHTARWIALVLRSPYDAEERPLHQYFFLSVSATQDARGYWNRFAPIDPNCLPLTSPCQSMLGPDEAIDYPTLGVSADAVIVTLNIVNLRLLRVVRAAVLVFPKPGLLSTQPGAQPRVLIFRDLPPLVSPPIVRDANTTAFLMAPVPVFTASPDPAKAARTFYVYAAERLDDPRATRVTRRRDINPANVPPYFWPAPADECSAGHNPNDPRPAPVLDASDTRFVSAGTQIGNSLFQVHTTSMTANELDPRPRFYEFDTAQSDIVQTGQLYASTYSDDLKASIAVTASKDLYATWTATIGEQTPCVQPQVRFGGRRATDPPGQISYSSSSYLPHPNPQYSNSSSTSFLSTPQHTGKGTPERWGDYSSITLDPSTDPQVLGLTDCPNGTRAWMLNETVSATTVWSSRIGAVGYCS